VLWLIGVFAIVVGIVMISLGNRLKGEGRGRLGGPPTEGSTVRIGGNMDAGSGTLWPDRCLSRSPSCSPRHRFRGLSTGPAAQQAAPASPQQAAPAAQPGDGDAQPFKPEELEAIVAPIALYPDPLVAQVLMAATYPLEVIQAARLMKSKPNLKDAALNEELKKYDWDDSVKSLCSFPQTLDILNEKID
jgi:hypothetical protein